MIYIYIKPMYIYIYVYMFKYCIYKRLNAYIHTYIHIQQIYSKVTLGWFVENPGANQCFSEHDMVPEKVAEKHHCGTWSHGGEEKASPTWDESKNVPSCKSI